MCGINHKEDKTSSYRKNDIEVLSERLRSLKIINKASEEISKWLDEEISIVPTPANENIQATMFKSMVSDLG